jgi:hypothetical protein
MLNTDPSSSVVGSDMFRIWPHASLMATAERVRRSALAFIAPSGSRHRPTSMLMAESADGEALKTTSRRMLVFAEYHHDNPTL